MRNMRMMRIGRCIRMANPSPELPRPSWKRHLGRLQLSKAKELESVKSVLLLKKRQFLMIEQPLLLYQMHLFEIVGKPT